MTEFYFRDDVEAILRSALEAGTMTSNPAFLAGYIKAIVVVARAFGIRWSKLPQVADGPLCIEGPADAAVR